MGSGFGGEGVANLFDVVERHSLSSAATWAGRQRTASCPSRAPSGL